MYLHFESFHYASRRLINRERIPSWLNFKLIICLPNFQKCANESKELGDSVLNFIKKHPLMDRAVPAFGGEPVLVHAGFNFRFTQITVDWQVKGADSRFYDVLFVGTGMFFILPLSSCLTN